MANPEKPFRRECKLLPQTPPRGSVSGVNLKRFATLPEALTAPIPDGYYIARITERIENRIVVRFEAGSAAN